MANATQELSRGAQVKSVEPEGTRVLPVGIVLKKGLKGSRRREYEIVDELSGNGGFGIVYKAEADVEVGNISSRH